MGKLARRVERRIVDELVAYEMFQRHQWQKARQPDLLDRSPHSCRVDVVNADDGVVRVLPSRRKAVLILGGGSSRHGAPLDDPRYEVWSCNDLAPYAVDSEGRFRADRWFEIHPKDPVVQWRRRPDFWAWLATLPIPVYQFARRDNPQSLEFPLQRVIDAGRDYFGCTFCYQIGLAIAEGFKEIALYGVDLETAREATVERGTVEWWAGYAAGQGIRVVWPQFPLTALRAGNHPYRYAHPATCELERAMVYDWMRDQYRKTIGSFLLGNRPPRTLREWWAWHRADGSP